MGRCKDCKYWAKGHAYMYAGGLHQGACELIKQYGRAEILAKLQADLSAKDSPWSAKDSPTVLLLTHEQFGCIHFERKPAEEK